MLAGEGADGVGRLKSGAPTEVGAPDEDGAPVCNRPSVTGRDAERKGRLETGAPGTGDVGAPDFIRPVAEDGAFGEGRLKSGAPFPLLGAGVLLGMLGVAWSVRKNPLRGPEIKAPWHIETPSRQMHLKDKRRNARQSARWLANYHPVLPDN